jgi:hypothetical protein
VLYELPNSYVTFRFSIPAYLIGESDHLVSGLTNQVHREALEVGYGGKYGTDQRSNCNAAVGPMQQESEEMITALSVQVQRPTMLKRLPLTAGDASQLCIFGARRSR